MTPKPVVYVVVDGMGTDGFEQAVASGRAPAFAFLRENASYVRDSVAVFPTITPAATASLVTGEIPARHGIPGMCWYDRQAERFVNYGQSPRAAVVEGFSQVVEDVMENMNSHHLSKNVSTIHEQLDPLGVITASINFMIFRGPYKHELEPNLLARLLFRKQLPDRLSGPKEHYFADVIRGPSEACSKLLSARGIEKRLKATDAWASCITRDLLENDAAQMILFYLHENDHWSHRKGPESQLDNLADADEKIANVLETFGSWEETLSKVGFVITADHSQSPISDEKDHILEFGDLLGDFRLLKPGRGAEPFKRNEAAAAGNGRVGFVYLNERRKAKLFEPVIGTLLQEPGVDQVMWRDEDAFVVDSHRGRLRFWDAREAGGVADELDNKWSFEGELGAVGGVVEDDRIRTPEYPLAMWRIASAIALDRMGDIVVTPKLTYEFADLAGGDHRGGGDHASLHAQDSLVPFLSTLSDPPLRPTTVDVVPHIVGHFRRRHE
ncbi:MAG: alkaline phosphatase family protein [Actinomycetota bacterium]|nr:alkaline phosphatase family protein [Actinomycetota bacterium]